VRLIQWSAAPYDVTPTQRKNYINVQIDAVGVGLASAASPFLPVFLTRLGASDYQIGLLTTMPALTGLILAFFIGRFLQRRRNIVPWFSASRLIVLSSYAATGLAVFVVPDQYLIQTILAIWALATLPQTALAVCFSVVMNSVAGPTRRFDLLSRRWTILGFTSAVVVAIVGFILGRTQFPLNYQMVFIGLSLGGVISFYFSSLIQLPNRTLNHFSPAKSLRQRIRSYSIKFFTYQDFVSFSIKRFVYMLGISLAIPLFPIYYVRDVHANDAWIGIFSMAQTAMMLVGYSIWTRESRRRSSQFVLIWTTLGLGIYPALVALTDNLALITLFAGLAGFFQAGIDLIFFEEIMKTIPEEQSATFVSISESMQYASAVFAPMLGAFLSTQIGLGGGLLFSAGIRLIGVALFAVGNSKSNSTLANSTADN